MPRPPRLRQETETTATVRHQRSLQRHRTIERPRLLALLDGSDARIRTLVAPAGYGKTTLAEQWIRRDDRRGAWFIARPSSIDVAALALDVARVSTPLVPDCDVRLREHLRAIPASADNVELVAEILAEDLGAWPPDGWLVIDDYHQIARGVEAERFVAAIARTTPVQLLIASRQRPTWVTTRGVLYGEVLELNQTALAMDVTEAAEVLTGERAGSASGLVAIANGWPAVIGLASVSGAELDGEFDQLPESLYRFFAEEVYSALDESVRAGLATLAIAPVLDREVAAKLLGHELADTTCGVGLDVGVIAERGGELELHPLCRSFLEERGEQAGHARDDETIARCIDHYHARRAWDAAFEVVSRFGVLARLEGLLADALDELLDSARLSTIDAWCELASEHDLDEPIILLASAETALRRGRYAEAQARAEAAAERGPQLAFRALSIAGRAAHLASREEEGQALYRRAEEVASTEGERRDALWGQLRCLIDLEASEARDVLEDLAEGVLFSDAREVVRLAGHRLHHQLRFERVSLVEADRAHQLLSTIHDPLVESSFQSAYAAALALAARYNEALVVSEDLVATAEQYRLDFAIPYALCSMATARAGLRQWAGARACIDEISSIATTTRDAHAEQLAYALLVRVLSQQGLHRLALSLEIPSLDVSLAAARAEVIASRSLVLATAGRVDEALTCADSVRGTTHAVEVRVLLAAVDAVSGVKAHAPDTIERIQGLEAVSFETGALDFMITAYRSNPPLLALLLKASADPDRLAAVIRRVGDRDLASAVGQPIVVDEDPVVRLSPREKEVHALLLQGITNNEIAKLLFISPSTSKLHTHRIYAKLGLRSRTALLAHAALTRADQATSATDNADSDGS